MATWGSYVTAEKTDSWARVGLDFSYSSANASGYITITATAYYK